MENEEPEAARKDAVRGERFGLSFRTAILLLLILAGPAILSQFFRSATGVIGPNLMADLDLSAEALGALTAAFFFTFAFTQIPTGILLDRFGSRLTISSMLIFAVAGSLLFAAAEGFWHVVTARLLIGVGCAGIMMGAFAVLARWFPASHFAMVIGVMVAISNAGNLLATTPMAMAAEAIGWRATFLVMALVTLAVAILIYAFLRDAPPGHDFNARKAESAKDVWQGLRVVLGNRQLPYILVLAFVIYGSTISILGLWGAPFLYDVYGLDAVARGNILLAMALGHILGTLGFGPLDRIFNTRKRIVIAGISMSILCLSALAFLDRPPLPLVVALLVGFGVFNAANLVMVAHGRALFPDHLVGRGMTTVNLAVQCGAGTLQMLTAFIVGLFAVPSGGSSPEGYRLMFAALALLLLTALAIYSRVEDVPPR